MNLFNIRSKYNDIVNILISINLSAFIFFWDIPIINFNIFYIILIPVILLCTKFENFEILKNNFLLLISFFLIIFFYVFVKTGLEAINIGTFFNFFGFFLTFVFCLFFKDEIKNNLKIVVLFFISIYTFFNFYDLTLNFKQFEISNLFFLDNYRCHYATSFFRNNYLFRENSHFGMIGVSTIFFLTYLLSINNKVVMQCILFFTAVSLFFNSSTTFLLGYVISFLAIYICCYNQLNKKFKTISTLFLIVCLYLLFFSNSCSKRFQDISNVAGAYSEIYKIEQTFKNENNMENKKKSENKNIENKLTEKELFAIDLKNYYTQFFKYMDLKNTNANKEDLLKEKNLLIELEKKVKKYDLNKFNLINQNFTSNLTTQVYLRSFYIMYESIKLKPFGWGINNYEKAFEKLKYDVPYINPDIINLNSSDASNNFAKLITEFGIIGFFLLIFLTYICLNKKIDLEVKLFHMPIILTQLIRGAGYFNGGFIFAINILIILYICNYKKSFNVNTRN